MSREIKFRVWNKNTNKYEYTELDYYFVIDQRVKAYEYEQYTGLKDKNGKEIYEGDIANLAYYEKPHGKKRWNKTYPHKGGKDINVVGFEDGYFKFHQEDKDGYGSELVFSDYGEWEGRDCKYKYEAEIIGNIHENPELLGGEE